VAFLGGAGQVVFEAVAAAARGGVVVGIEAVGEAALERRALGPVRL
jgi:hypothetical protein